MPGIFIDALDLVMIVIAIDVLLGSIRAVLAGLFQVKKFIRFLQTGILFTVLPLTVIMHLFTLDPTGFVFKVIFLAGAIGVIIKYIIDIIVKLRQR